jgi:SAM-dependent methyltransferase
VWRPQLPQALWWDHNAYYHQWLLRLMPDRVHSALDAGCGAGGLSAKLADRADRVDAVDVSEAMIERASALAPGRANWLHGDLLDDSLPLDPAGYDLVVAVTSLHHLPLRAGLQRLAGLVRPGGVLAIIGMYRRDTAADQAMEVLALPANAVMGAVLAASGRAGKPHDVGMPIRDPFNTLAEIRAAADEYVPGALLRRRLFWRYSLLWRRP